MPELPEVETVRRTVAARLVGRRVSHVALHRPDVVRGDVPLVGGRLVEVMRHGKQLALRFDGGGCVCVHLGMSGQLLVGGAGEGGGETAERASHVHVTWAFDADGNGIDDAGARLSLRFRDPRRFGGVWVFPSAVELHARRWSRLGPDALTVTPRPLGLALSRTGRAVKAALLDQALVAGLGNIYVDELLFAAGIDPRRPAAAVAESPGAVRGLVGRMRRLLHRAIAAGGSTLRDYVDAEGRAGSFADRHRVYGRGGLPCVRCRTLLSVAVVAGRRTVWCPRCQG